MQIPANMPSWMARAYRSMNDHHIAMRQHLVLAEQHAQSISSAHMGIIQNTERIGAKLHKKSNTQSQDRIYQSLEDDTKKLNEALEYLINKNPNIICTHTRDEQLISDENVEQIVPARINAELINAEKEVKKPNQCTTKKTQIFKSPMLKVNEQRKREKQRYNPNSTPSTPNYRPNDPPLNLPTVATLMKKKEPLPPSTLPHAKPISLPSAAPVIRLTSHIPKTSLQRKEPMVQIENGKEVTVTEFNQKIIETSAKQQKRKEDEGSEKFEKDINLLLLKQAANNHNDDKLQANVTVLLQQTKLTSQRSIKSFLTQKKNNQQQKSTASPTPSEHTSNTEDEEHSTKETATTAAQATPSTSTLFPTQHNADTERHSKRGDKLPKHTATTEEDSAMETEQITDKTPTGVDSQMEYDTTDNQEINEEVIKKSSSKIIRRKKQVDKVPKHTTTTQELSTMENEQITDETPTGKDSQMEYDTTDDQEIEEEEIKKSSTKIKRRKNKHHPKEDDNITPKKRKHKHRQDDGANKKSKTEVKDTPTETKMSKKQKNNEDSPNEDKQQQDKTSKHSSEERNKINKQATVPQKEKQVPDVSPHASQNMSTPKQSRIMLSDLQKDIFLKITPATKQTFYKFRRYTEDVEKALKLCKQEVKTGPNKGAFQCQNCDFERKTKWDIDRHIVTVHFKFQRYQCTRQDCNFIASHSDTVIKHYVNSHLEEVSTLFFDN